MCQQRQGGFVAIGIVHFTGGRQRSQYGKEAETGGAGAAGEGEDPEDQRRSPGAYGNRVLHPGRVLCMQAGCRKESSHDG